MSVAHEVASRRSAARSTGGIDSPRRTVAAMCSQRDRTRPDVGRKLRSKSRPRSTVPTIASSATTSQSDPALGHEAERRRPPPRRGAPCGRRRARRAGARPAACATARRRARRKSFCASSLAFRSGRSMPSAPGSARLDCRPLQRPDRGRCPRPSPALGQQARPVSGSNRCRCSALNHSSVSSPWRTLLAASRRATTWLPSCAGRSTAPASSGELLELRADDLLGLTSKYA